MLSKTAYPCWIVQVPWIEQCSSCRIVEGQYYGFLIDRNSLPDKSLPHQNIVFVYKFSYKSSIIVCAVLFWLYFLTMSPRLPPHHVWQICVALYYSWAVEWIVAATQIHKTTIYHIRTSLDVWGTPYPPSLAKIGRPQVLTTLHENVCDD